MVSKKIFLGTVERFWDNDKALSLHSMMDPFGLSNQFDFTKVGYSINVSSSMLSDKYAALESIFEGIDKSEIAIIDITPDDKTGIPNDFVLNLFYKCLQSNKKIILLYNINSIVFVPETLSKKVKDGNLLGLLTHDKTLPKQVMEKVDAYYSTNSKYNKNTVVTITDTKNDVKNAFKAWVKEKELGFCSNIFLNIHMFNETIDFSYEGYNTPSLFRLSFDLSKLSDDEKDSVYQEITRMFPQTENIHVTNHVLIQGR